MGTRLQGCEILYHKNSSEKKNKKRDKKTKEILCKNRTNSSKTENADHHQATVEGHTTYRTRRTVGNALMNNQRKYQVKHNFGVIKPLKRFCDEYSTEAFSRIVTEK